MININISAARQGDNGGGFLPFPFRNPNQTDIVSNKPEIVIEQIDQVLDQLISQLFAFKKTVAEVREKMAEVSTPALGNGILKDEQIAALLNKREKTLAKKHY